MLYVIRADICNAIQKPGIIMACHDVESGGQRGVILDLFNDDYARPVVRLSSRLGKTSQVMINRKDNKQND